MLVETSVGIMVGEREQHMEKLCRICMGKVKEDAVSGRCVVGWLFRGDVGHWLLQDLGLLNSFSHRATASGYCRSLPLLCRKVSYLHKGSSGAQGESRGVGLSHLPSHLTPGGR